MSHTFRRLAVTLVAIAMPLSAIAALPSQAGAVPKAAPMRFLVNTGPKCTTHAVTLPLNGTVDAVIKWGDHSSQHVTSPLASFPTHTYKKHAARVNHIVRVYGTVTWFGQDNTLDPVTTCIKKVQRWGNVGLTSLSGAFYGSTANKAVPAPPLTVTNLSAMFEDAVNFNKPVASWNTSNVVDTNSMFSGATAFNQPIDSWNTSKLADASFMFGGATAFNQPLNDWNLQANPNLIYMFSNATSFNQSLGAWNVSDLAGLLTNSGISTANYGDTLVQWASRPELSGVELDADSTTYPASAAAAHNTLSTTDGWYINDSGPAS